LRAALLPGLTHAALPEPGDRFHFSSDLTLASKSRDKPGMGNEGKTSPVATSPHLWSVANPWSFEHPQTTQTDA